MKVSIVVPVYNVEKYIQRTVENLISQTFTDFEILLVDNNSTDRSLQIMKQLADKYDPSKIRLLSCTTQGVSAARNVGIQNAAGDYLCFIDADDTLSQRYLEFLVGALESGDGYDMAFCGFETIQKNCTVYMTKERHDHYYDSDRMLHRLFRVDDYQGFVWNKLFRSEIIKKNGLFFDEGIHYNEDRLFIFEYMQHAESAIMIPEHLYFYELRDSSAQDHSGRRLPDEKLMTEIDAFLKMIDLLEEREEVSSAKQESDRHGQNKEEPLHEIIVKEMLRKEILEFRKLLNRHSTFAFRKNPLRNYVKKTTQYHLEAEDETEKFEYGRMRLYGLTGFVFWQKKN